MKLGLVALGWLAVIATLIPLSRGDAWWIRAFDFPRVQITVLAVAFLLAIVFAANPHTFVDHITIAAIAGSIVLQARQIFPYSPFSSLQVQTSNQREFRRTLRLLIANVFMDNRNSTQLKDQIRAANPDVILVVEADLWWQSQLESLRMDHPYSVAYPLRNTYGMLLYSRLQLIDPEVRFLVQGDVPSIHTGIKLESGAEVNLHCIHPRPPRPSHHPRSTERDAELILVGKEVRKSGSPAVVAGDLNDVAWSHTTRLFQKVSGLLDPRVGRGLFGTFHARYPFLRWPLDHVFHSNDFRLIELKVLDYFGSDHLPVLAALSYEPAAANAQDELDDPNQEERREMRKVIEKALNTEPED